MEEKKMKVNVNGIEKELVYLKNGINVASEIVLDFDKVEQEDDIYIMTSEQYEFWEDLLLILKLANMINS